VQPRPKIGPWREALDRPLAENAARPSRERVRLTGIFEDLRGLGYEGGYDAVRRHAAGWHRRLAEATASAFVPLSFAPGEAYQFDWSHEVVLIDGATVTVKVAHVRRCHSRMLFVRAYPRETPEMVFDAHDRAFAFFKGACTRGIYDNMKTAVDTIFVSRKRAYNRRFQQMCAHYLVEPPPLSLGPMAQQWRPCTPASGWEKGQVENQVGVVRQRFFSPRLRVKSYEELNGWLMDRCIAHARRSRIRRFGSGRSGRCSKPSGRASRRRQPPALLRPRRYRLRPVASRAGPRVSDLLCVRLPVHAARKGSVDHHEKDRRRTTGRTSEGLRAA
jgi:transposase